MMLIFQAYYSGTFKTSCIKQDALKGSQQSPSSLCNLKSLYGVSAPVLPRACQFIFQVLWLVRSLGF
ncbi:hypothetical protein M758_1G238600 [Ceratodon purpureus]|nr:hypothetical protein M758_1G238600 [Ceratodon purpureus]